MMQAVQRGVHAWALEDTPAMRELVDGLHERIAERAIAGTARAFYVDEAVASDVAAVRSRNAADAGGSNDESGDDVDASRGGDDSAGGGGGGSGSGGGGVVVGGAAAAAAPAARMAAANPVAGTELSRRIMNAVVNTLFGLP
jgi:hypothetical protein